MKIIHTIRSSNVSVTHSGSIADGKGADIGYLFANDPACGTTNLQMRDMTVAKCKVGIQCGEKPEDHNAAEGNFDRLKIEHCDTAFKVVHDQGQDYTFRSAWLQWCKTCFDISRGGGLLVSGQTAQGCDTLLKTGEGGPNCSAIGITDLRWENGGPLLAGNTSGGGVVVDLIRISVASSQLGERPLLTVAGGVFCTLSSSVLWGLPAGTKIVLAGTKDRAARLYINNCPGVESFTLIKGPLDVCIVDGKTVESFQ